MAERIRVGTSGWYYAHWRRIVELVTRFHRLTLGAVALILLFLLLRSRRRRQRDSRNIPFPENRQTGAGIREESTRDGKP